MKASNRKFVRSHAPTAAMIALCLAATVLPAHATNPIWINPWTCGQPIGATTYYLGDSLGSTWYVNFEIGQTSWDYAQVGYGTNPNGTGYNWGAANWYEDGSGSNKRVRRNIGGLKFTATGNWYIICQAKESSGDTYTSRSDCGWANSTAYPPSTLSYFTVNALTPPSGQSASPASGSQINLAWTKGVSGGSAKDTLILRSTSPITTDPTQGTTYNAGNTVGSATVIYRGNAATLDDTSLAAGTHYYYKFYAENFSYYSSGVSADACTVLAAPGTTGASRCGSGSLTLSATGSGGTLKWYSDPGLTTQVATGASYSPTLTTTTTTFYVTETSASGCVSAASTVTGTINAEPTAANAGYQRGQGASLKIKIADLTTDTLQGLGTAAHGTLSHDATYIFYEPSDNQNDSFTYTTANANCTKQATITVTVVDATGQVQGITTQGGKATMSFAGIPGFDYIVQRAEDVNFTVNLSDRLTTNVPANGLFLFEEETTLPQAHYRLKYKP